jgi:hypothetical protein
MKTKAEFKILIKINQMKGHINKSKLMIFLIKNKIYK